MSRRKRRRAAAESDGSERWLITFADLVTLLFALFIVLFASAEPSGEKFARTAASLRNAFDSNIFGSGSGGGESSIFDESGRTIVPDFGDSKTQDVQLLSDELTEAALELGVFNQVQVSVSDDGIVISLADNLLFSPAEATISEDALPILERISALLARGDNEVRIEGHTDNIPVNSGDFSSNWELSTARATAVLRHLVGEGGVDPTRIHAAGFAEFQPIADNGTADGRSQNRRADVVILYPPAAETNGATGNLRFTPAEEE